MKNCLGIASIALVCTLPLSVLAQQVVTFGVRWTDNRGNYEIQNPVMQTVADIEVTYQILGKTSTSPRLNNLKRRVCGKLKPQEICKFQLEWSPDSPINIISIHSKVDETASTQRLTSPR